MQIFTLLLSVMFVPFTAFAFSDVPQHHQYYSAIEWAKKHTIPAPTANPPALIEGYADGTFRPDTFINRAEFLKIVIDGNGRNMGGYAGISQRQFFPDVPPGVWYTTHLASAKQLYIIEGYPDGTFRPERPISFVEAAKILVNAREQLVHASDANEEWYTPYVDYLIENDATPPSITRLDQNITRAEMVHMMYRLALEENTAQHGQYSNIIANDRMLLVFSAPSVHSEYYRDDFAAIVEFQKRYAQTVLGNDNVIILVDEDTKPYYADTLPEDVLLEATVDDIWIRDFSTVLPETMVQFAYDPSYFESSEDAEIIQESFTDFMEAHDLRYEWNDYVLDGGNIVDNGNGKLITTTRFLESNALTQSEAKAILKEATGAKEVAIIEYDDEVMGHADGMVMWGDKQTLFVNAYDEPFRSTVMDELKSSFTGINIVEVPATFSYTQWRDFNSACGVNLNSTVTYNHIYTPTFNQSDADASALNIIRAHTGKSVHTIPAEHVCHMGGSVRCLSWQITGENANKLIQAAR